MKGPWRDWREWREWTPNPRPPDDTSVFQEHRNWLNLRIVLLVTRFTFRCPEVVRILSLGMDKPLPLTMRLKLRVHYLMCSFCERYAKQLQYMRTAAHEFPEKIGDVAEEKLPDDVKERMRLELKL
jgi:hypothetical protein